MRLDQATKAALTCLRKILSAIPAQTALGEAWGLVQRHKAPRQQPRMQLRVARAQLAQAKAQLEQLRQHANRAAGAGSVAHLNQETEEGVSRAEDQLLATDRLSQMRAIAFALERIIPELEDIVEEADLQTSIQKTGEPLLFTSQTFFTCPVCFDDEVSVQDAFVVSACGHPVCRPCAVRSVDYNIKQLQPQVCPTCMGTPCPCCPITVWQRTRDLHSRRSQRHAQRRAELHLPRRNSHAHCSACFGWAMPNHCSGVPHRVLSLWGCCEHCDGCRSRIRRDRDECQLHGDAGAAEAAADDDGTQRHPSSSRRVDGGELGVGGHGNGAALQQRAEETDAPPQIKFCCMSQVDMRLLLQPEELQRQQQEAIAQRKRAREQRRLEQQQQQQQQQGRKGRGRKRRRGVTENASFLAGQPGPSGLHAQLSIVPASDSEEERAGTAHGLCARPKGHSSATAAATAAATKGRGRNNAVPGSSSSAAEAEALRTAVPVALTGWEEEEEEEEEEMQLPPSYEAYLKAEALRAAHSSQLFKLCPKCGEGIELLASGSERNRLRCPTCKADKCLACGVDWHENSTCKQYQQWSRENAQADEEFKKLVARGEIQPCPRCGIAVAKEPGGCDHMRCKCGCYYCYKCGKEKSGVYIQTHGCPCMNGAAWRHDWRAQLPPGDPRLPPLPGAQPAAPLAVPAQNDMALPAAQAVGRGNRQAGAPRIAIRIRGR